MLSAGKTDGSLFSTLETLSNSLFFKGKDGIKIKKIYNRQHVREKGGLFVGHTT